MLKNEQKYHTLNKHKSEDILSDQKHEVIVLKSVIQRERNELRDCELKINELFDKQKKLKSDINSANAMNLENNNLY